MRGSCESWGLNSTHIHGTHVPVEEPSTASKAAILVGEAEQRRAAPEDALWMDAPDFAVAQAGLRIQSSI
jgi:hypothetical protein